MEGFADERGLVQLVIRGGEVSLPLCHLLTAQWAAFPPQIVSAQNIFYSYENRLNFEKNWFLFGGELFIHSQKKSFIS